MKVTPLIRGLAFSFFLMLSCQMLHAENGYDLWLRYAKITNRHLSEQYKSLLPAIIQTSHTPTLDIATRELNNGVRKMLDLENDLPLTVLSDNDNVHSMASLPAGIILGTADNKQIAPYLSSAEKKEAGQQGYIIKSVGHTKARQIIIAANTDIGVLYGSFHLLRLVATQRSLTNLYIASTPKLKLRMLDHWDNLNGTIERGYAGYSIWNWQTLPGIIQKRYVDYARANASIGINGVVLNNVNASVQSLTTPYLIKTAALAKTFKPYGIKVYLTAKFSAPIELGKLKTADPLDPAVINWWKDKVAEIYHYMPNFGGFLVKASSEGQPGPGDYGRSHADGANMMAAALKPYGGIVIWRTFVYAKNTGVDRARQGYIEFKPLDGKFDKNVLLQAKYGPIDFQPREAFNPLFGVMPHTQMMMEFQITQEYLGFATHLVYLGTLFQEYLQKDTYQTGKGTTIAKVLEGRSAGQMSDNRGLTGMAGVANIGTDLNWCGHPFGQANWYAYGRFAWDPEGSADSIADDWLRMTFTNDDSFVRPVKKMMLHSREVAVHYMTPMGLSHMMQFGTHYGPGPWTVHPASDAKDYFKADAAGLGVDRTAAGTDAIKQYAPYLQQQYKYPATTPLDILLWFHHIGWTQKISTGKTLWNELVGQFYQGASEVDSMQAEWQKMRGKIDKDRFEFITQLLGQQYREAKWWRDGCVLYFQTFSKLPLPAGYEVPDKTFWQIPKFKPKLPFPYKEGN